MAEQSGETGSSPKPQAKNTEASGHGAAAVAVDERSAGAQNPASSGSSTGNEKSSFVGRAISKLRGSDTAPQAPVSSDAAAMAEQVQADIAALPTTTDASVDSGNRGLRAVKDLGRRVFHSRTRTSHAPAGAGRTDNAPVGTDAQDSGLAAPLNADTTAVDRGQVTEAARGTTTRKLGPEDLGTIARTGEMGESGKATVQIVDVNKASPEAAPPNAESSKKLVVEGKVATNEAVVQEGSRVGRAVHQRREAAEKGRIRGEKRQKRRDARNERLNIQDDDAKGIARKALVARRAVRRAPEALRKRVKDKVDSLGKTEAGRIEQGTAVAVDILKETPEVTKVLAKAAGHYFRMTNESMRGRAVKARSGLEAVVLQAALGGTLTMSDALDHKLTEIEQKQREAAPPKEKEKKRLRDRVSNFGRQAAMQARELPAAKAKIVAEIMDRVLAGNIPEAIALYGDEELVNLVIQHHSGEAAAIAEVTDAVPARDVGEAASQAFKITFDEATTAALGKDLTPFIKKRAQEIKAARERTTPVNEREVHATREFTLIDYMGWLQDSEVGQKFSREYPELTLFGKAQMIARTVDTFAGAALNTVEGLEADGNVIADAILRNQAEGGTLSWEFGDTAVEVGKRIKARGAGEGAAFMDAYTQARGSGATNAEAIEIALQVDVKEAAKRAAHDAGIYLAKYGVRWPARLAILAQLGTVGWRATPAGLVTSSALGAAMAGGLGFLKGWERAREGVELSEIEASRGTELSANAKERKIEQRRGEKGHTGRRLRYMLGTAGKTAGKQALAGAIGAPLAAEVIGGAEHFVAHAAFGSGGGHVEAPGQPGGTVGNNHPGGLETGGNGPGGSNVPPQSGGEHGGIQLTAYDTRSDGNPQSGEIILVGEKEIPVRLGNATFDKDAIVGGGQSDPGISAQHLKQFEEIISQQNPGKDVSYTYDGHGGFSVVRDNAVVGHLTYDQGNDKFELIQSNESNPQIVTPLEGKDQFVNALVVKKGQETVIITSNDKTDITLTGVSLDANDILVNSTTGQPILPSAELLNIGHFLGSNLQADSNFGLHLLYSDKSGSTWQVTQNGKTATGFPEVKITPQGEVEVGGKAHELVLKLGTQDQLEFIPIEAAPTGQDVIHVGNNIDVEVKGFKVGSDGGLWDKGHEVLNKAQLDRLTNGIGDHLQIVGPDGKPVPVEIVLEKDGNKPVLTVYDLKTQEPLLRNAEPELITVPGQKRPDIGFEWEAASGIKPEFDGRTLTFQVSQKALDYTGSNPTLVPEKFDVNQWVEDVTQAVEHGKVQKIGPLEIQGFYQNHERSLLLGDENVHVYVMSATHFKEFSEALTEHLKFEQVEGGHWDKATGKWVDGTTGKLTPLLKYNPNENAFDVVDAGHPDHVLLRDVTISDNNGHPVLNWSKDSDVVTYEVDTKAGIATLTVHDGVSDASVQGVQNELPNQINFEELVHQVTTGQRESENLIHVGNDITVDVKGFRVGSDGGLWDKGHEVLTKAQWDQLQGEVAGHVQVVDATTGQQVPVEVVVGNQGGKPVVTVLDANGEPLIKNEQVGFVQEYVNGQPVTETVKAFGGTKQVGEKVLGLDWQAAPGIKTEFDGTTITFSVPENVLSATNGQGLEWETFNAGQWVQEVNQAIEHGPVMDVGGFEIQGLWRNHEGSLFFGDAESHVYVMSNTHFEQFSQAITEHLKFEQVVGGQTKPLTPFLKWNATEKAFDIVNGEAQTNDPNYVLLRGVTITESKDGPILEWEKGSDVVTYGVDTKAGIATLTVHDGVSDASVQGVQNELPNQINFEELVHQVTAGQRGQGGGGLPIGSAGTEPVAQIGEFEIVGLHSVNGALQTTDGVTIINQNELPLVTRTLELMQIEKDGTIVQHPELIFNQETGEFKLVDASNPQDVLMTGHLGTTVSGHPEIMWDMTDIRATQSPNGGIIINTDLNATTEQGNIDLVTGQLQVHNAPVPAGVATIPPHIQQPGEGESTQQFLDKYNYNPDNITFDQQGTLHTALIDNGNTERIFEEGGVHSTHLALEVDGKKIFVRVKYDEYGRAYVDMPLNDKSSYLHERLSVYGHRQSIEAGSLSAFENQTNLSDYLAHDLPPGTLQHGVGDTAIAEHKGGLATLNATISFCNITNANGVTTVTYNNAIVGTGLMPDHIEVSSAQAGIPLTATQQPAGSPAGYGPSGQGTQFGQIEVEGLPNINQGITIGGQHITGAQLQQVGQLVQENLRFEAQGPSGNVAVTPEVIFNRDGSITILDAQTGEPLVTGAHIAINPSTQQLEFIGNAVGVGHQDTNGVETITFNENDPYLATTTINLPINADGNLKAIEALIQASQEGNPGNPTATTELIYVNPTAQQTTTLDLNGARLYSSGALVDGQHETTISSLVMQEYQRVLPQIQVRNSDGNLVNDVHYVYENDSFNLVDNQGHIIAQFYFDASNNNQLDWNGSGSLSGNTFTIGNETNFGSLNVASFGLTSEPLLEVMPNEVTLTTPNNQTVTFSDVTRNPINGDFVNPANPNIPVLSQSEVNTLIPLLTKDMPKDISNLNFAYAGEKGQDSLWHVSYGGNEIPGEIAVTPSGEILVNEQQASLTFNNGQLIFTNSAGKPIASSAYVSSGQTVPPSEQHLITGEEVAKTWESLSAKPGTIKEVAFDRSKELDMSARVIENYDGHNVVEIIQSGGNARYVAFQMDINGQHETIFADAVPDGDGRSHFILDPLSTERVRITTDGESTSTITLGELSQLMLHQRDLSHLPLGSLSVAQESELFRPKVISAADFADGKVTYKAALLGDNILASEVTVSGSQQPVPGAGVPGGGQGRGGGNAVTAVLDRPLHAVENAIDHELGKHRKQAELAGAITAGYGMLGFAQPVDRRFTPWNRFRRRFLNARRYAVRGAVLGVGAAALAPLTGPIAGAAKVGAIVGGVGTGAVRAMRPFTTGGPPYTGERELARGVDLAGRRLRRTRRLIRRGLITTGHGAEGAVTGAVVGGGLAAAGVAGLHAAGVGIGHGATHAITHEPVLTAMSGPSGAAALGPLPAGAVGTEKLVELGAAAVPVVYGVLQTAQEWARSRAEARRTPAAPPPAGPRATPLVPVPPPPPPGPAGPVPPLPRFVRRNIGRGVGAAGNIAGTVVGGLNTIFNPLNEARRLRRADIRDSIETFRNTTAAVTDKQRRTAARNYLRYRNIQVRQRTRQDLILAVARGRARRMITVPTLSAEGRLNTSPANLLARLPRVGLPDDQREAITAVWTNMHGRRGYLNGRVNNHLRTSGDGVGLTRRALAEIIRVVHAEDGTLSATDEALRDRLRRFVADPTRAKQATLRELWTYLTAR